ncbi:dihydrofolate reductase family protein [Clostridium sp. D53t1_180928_C8]|uniref:dihydrofolate reductase family protein n=1 Tax=Clostridium sp. D53t1_180928_C8 TaxID=2787101 RepID=UPI0018AA8C3B|nr:dihydrofolate reductase family protein [Clostridium sp. D53t1_180928_C8]
MRKVILYIATSLDGYIADHNGDVNWLSGQDESNTEQGSYPEFIETIDTVILGYKTYHQVVTELSPDIWVYKGKQSYVITNKNIENKEEIIFTNKNLGDLISNLKKQQGKNIWICGGASIVNQLLELNLIDEFCISIIPTILGDGISLFDKQIKEKKLELVSTRTYNGIVDLWYKHRR